MVDVTKDGEQLTDEETNEVDPSIPVPTMDDEQEEWGDLETKEAFSSMCFDMWLKLTREVSPDDISESSQLWNLWREYLSWKKSHA